MATKRVVTRPVKGQLITSTGADTSLGLVAFSDGRPTLDTGDHFSPTSLFRLHTPCRRRIGVLTPGRMMRVWGCQSATVVKSSLEYSPTLSARLLQRFSFLARRPRPAREKTPLFGRRTGTTRSQILSTLTRANSWSSAITFGIRWS